MWLNSLFPVWTFLADKYGAWIIVIDGKAKAVVARWTKPTAWLESSRWSKPTDDCVTAGVLVESGTTEDVREQPMSTKLSSTMSNAPWP